VVALMPKARADLVRQVAVIFSLISGASSLYLLSEFVTKQGDFQFELRHAWMKSFGISWHFGVDGISLFLLVLTGVLFPLAIVAVDPGHDHKPYYAWLLVLMAGSMGVFVALDLVVFFLFFEIVLVPMYFLIGLWGHGDRIYAATKFFLYTMFGSALMLVGIVATAYLHQRGTGGDWTFDVVRSPRSPASRRASRWIFASFALAFAVKVPLFPLHTWLPDAHTEAPRPAR
jgi:NADH-quinone oxidoreductase subunit M